MGNESGEWIMHGLEWDNPACIHIVEKAIEHINDVGFLPLFKNEIEGFSLEEWTAPSTGGVMMNYMTRGCGVRL